MWKKIEDYRDVKNIKTGDRIRVNGTITYLDDHYINDDYGLRVHPRIQHPVYDHNVATLEDSLVRSGKYVIEIERLEKPVSECQNEMLLSFVMAVQDAKGDVRGLLARNPTLDQMMNTLAQNGIRFFYDSEGVAQ